MPRPKNAMEIFQILDKSNCRDCGMKTCLAFAGAVFRGEKSLQECPKLDQSVIDRFYGTAENDTDGSESQTNTLAQLLQAISRVDLSEAARRTGGVFNGNRLTLKILGKDFSVDANGHLMADIHVNPWVAAPFLDYVIYGNGVDPTGKWVSFRELKNGKERYPLFQKRCEQAMKRVADIYTPLFDDMVHMFGGSQVERLFEADISVVLHPLPKVPILICYQKPEDGLDSDLKVFFDETADKNLSIGSVFSLGTGLATMFERISQRHGIGIGN